MGGGGGDGRVIQLTRQLRPIDLGQSIDGDCWCKREMMGLVSERMDGRAEAEVSRRGFHRAARYQEKRSWVRRSRGGGGGEHWEER